MVLIFTAYGMLISAIFILFLTDGPYLASLVVNTLVVMGEIIGIIGLYILLIAHTLK